MTLSIFFKNFFRKDTTLRALKVAFVVAPILILINHFDTIMNRDFHWVFYLKSIITFFVPYTVSAFSSAMAYSQSVGK
ncbi:MAG TPA: nitrate/nitrite transporter NrtS [Thermodesulfobacteriota bacterium]|nr:nitrate/nitrite transporter NrtS [Thermodesulfobacteriota bacterium]